MSQTTAPAVAQDLQSQGFVLLTGVFDETILAPLRALTEEIIAYGNRGLVDPFQDYFLRHRTDQGTLYDLYYRHPEFRVLVHEPTLLDALETVLGPDLFLYENSLVYKPPGRRNEVPWHQDFINRTDEPKKYVAWVALDAVTVKNGAMKVIPGSHTHGFLPFFRVPGETHHTRLRLDGIDVARFVHVEMNAGDVLIFDQLLVHGSDRVEATTPRRAFRFATQGFESLRTPRAVPIVLRGGRPHALAARFPQKQTPQTPAATTTPQVAAPASLIKRALRRVGRALVQI